MVKENVLHSMRPYQEDLSYASTKGHKKVTDVVWQLFPSRQFAQEIIQGNVETSQWRSKHQSPKIVLGTSGLDTSILRLRRPIIKRPALGRPSSKVVPDRLAIVG